MPYEETYYMQKPQKKENRKETMKKYEERMKKDGRKQTTKENKTKPRNNT
jgi:hypothetical protein